MPIFDFHTHNYKNPAGEAIVNIPDHFLFHPEDFIPCPNFLYSAGIHPMFNGNWELALQGLEELIKQPSVVALGECGLDKRSSISLQEQSHYLEIQMYWADKRHLPLIIHCVRAWQKLIQLHKAHPTVMERIIHAFRGKPELARQLFNEGFLLSFGPKFNIESLIIFPENLRLIETDNSKMTIKEVYQIQKEALKKHFN